MKTLRRVHCIEKWGPYAAAAHHYLACWHRRREGLAEATVKKRILFEYKCFILQSMLKLATTEAN